MPEETRQQRCQGSGRRLTELPTVSTPLRPSHVFALPRLGGRSKREVEADERVTRHGRKDGRSCEVDGGVCQTFHLLIVSVNVIDMHHECVRIA